MTREPDQTHTEPPEDKPSAGGSFASSPLAPGGSGGLKRRLRFALFALIPPAVFLAIIEAVARIVYPGPIAEPTMERPYIQYDPALGWRHIARTERRCRPARGTD